MVLMCWSEAGTLRDRFDHAHMLLHLRRGRTYQGLVRALRRGGTRLIGVLRRHLAEVLATLPPAYWMIEGWCVFAVDGSKFDAPRTKANQDALGAAKDSRAQMLAVILVHLGLGVLWNWRVARSDGSERGRMRAMLASTPLGSLLVGDAGFMGYDCLRAVVQGGRHFLVRLAGNTKLITGLTDDPGVMALWPKDRDKEEPPLLVRVVRVPDGKGGEVMLGTSMMDRVRLTDAQAAVFYRLRWGVETTYRSLKQTLERRKMRSAAPTQARLEMHWTLLGMMLLGVLTLQRLDGRLNPARWSVAAALRAVHGAARSRTDRMARSCLSKLRHAVTPSTARKSKAARDWPHKKNPKPPGPPVVRAATAQEVLRSKALARTAA